MDEPRPASPGWPVLRKEAAALGISDRALRSRYRTVFPGVVVCDVVPDTIVVRSRAALLLGPEGGVVSHFTAARLWGGRVPDNEWTHVSFMRDVRFRVRGIKPHRYRHRLDVVKWHGMSVTSPTHTFCDMARFLGLVDLVALGDSLVRKGRCSPEDLVARATVWEGQFRSEIVAAAELVRPRVDSSPETALRLLMVLGGLPEPDIDITIRDEHGSVRFRMELGYEEQRLVIEYDSLRWHGADDQQAHDAARRDHLTATEGWRFVLVTGDQLFNGTEALLVRLHDEVRAAGVPTPPRLSEGWRQHFRVVQIAA